MRVAYLSTDFGVSIHGSSGSSVHVRQVVRALRHAGHATRLYSTSRYGDDKRFQDDDFQLVHLEGFADAAMAAIERQELGDLAHLRREFRRLIYSEFLQRALSEPLVRFAPHIIYERYSLFSYAGIELARSLGVPLILEVNAPLSIEASRHRGLVLTEAAKTLEAKIWRKASRIFVVSAMLKDYAQALGVEPERIEIVRTGVDTSVFAPTASAHEVRSNFGLSAKKVVGFVGSLKPWHDLDTLLAAMHQLVRADPTYHLLVVGDGPRMEELTRTNAGFVTYVGAVQHDDIPRFLAAMDVVAVPYAAGDIHYFSPIKLFEAMAMAKPIVGANIGQVAEVITHGEAGLLYEPGNTNELAASIQHLTDLPDRGAALGARARQLAQDRYGWQHVADQIIRSAESLLSQVTA